MERLHKFFQLLPTERRILAQAWMLLLIVELALRVLPFRRLLAFCSESPPSPPSPPQADQAGSPSRGEGIAIPPVQRLAWLVEVAGRYSPVTATCLKQALVLSWLLGQRGVATTLRIGVARDEAGLLAHAWLECQGKAIFGRPARDEFTPLVSPP